MSDELHQMRQDAAKLYNLPINRVTILEDNIKHKVYVWIQPIGEWWWKRVAPAAWV